MVNDYLKEVIDMETTNVIDFIGRLYETVKSDLYTLLVDGSTNKVDYNDKVTFFGKGENVGLVTFEYLLVNPTNISYIELVQACGLVLNHMLKQDIRLWGKAEIIEEFYGLSPMCDTNTGFTLSIKFKAKESNE